MFPLTPESASSARTMPEPFIRRPMPQPTWIEQGFSASAEATAKTSSTLTSAARAQASGERDEASARNFSKSSQYDGAMGSTCPRSKRSAAAPIARSKSPPGRTRIVRSAIFSPLCRTGSMRRIRVPAFFAF